jgi:hypothetical protein
VTDYLYFCFQLKYISRQEKSCILIYKATCFIGDPLLMSDTAADSDSLDASLQQLFNEAAAHESDSETTLSVTSDSELVPSAPTQPPPPNSQPPRVPTPPEDNMAPPEKNFMPFKMPEFDKANPEVFYNVLEGFFTMHNVTDQKHKYLLQVLGIPTKELGQDVLAMSKKQPPGDTPYQTLKDAVLENLIPASWPEVQQKMRSCQRGDMRPSQFLAKLRSYALPDMLDNKMFLYVLQEIFHASYPQEWSTTLALYTDIDEAAKHADTLFDRAQALRYNPFGAASLSALSTEVHPARLDSHSDCEKRFSSLEKSIAALKEQIALMNQRNSQPRQYNGQQQRNPRQPWRGNGKQRGNSHHRQQRAPSPSPLNTVVDGICGYHSRFKQAAERCVEGCNLYDSFLKMQSTFGASSSNSKGQQK